MSDAPSPAAPPKAAPAAAAPTDRSDKFISRQAQVDTIGKNKVVIGHGSVVHPFAVLKPTNGPILVGEYCIIDEGCVIENKITSEQDMRSVFELFPAGVAKTFGPNFGINPALNNATSAAAASAGGGAPNIPPTTLCIGNNNYFGPRVRIEGAAIGDGNVFEAMSSVGIMAVVQDGCHLRATTRVTHDAYVPSFTVVEGSSSQWRTNPAVTEPWLPERDILMRGAAPTDTPANAEGRDNASGIAMAVSPAAAGPAASSAGGGGAQMTVEQLQAQYLKDVSERAQAKSRYLRKVLKQ